MAAPALSIVIPTLDEVEHLPGLLKCLAAQKGVAFEVIVADGGSVDATKAITASFQARFVSAERGRGRQMNAAVRQAAGEYLLFLHADSLVDDHNLLNNALDYLKREIQHVGRDDVAGHFRLRFVRSSGAHNTAYRYAEEKTAFNRPGTTNGDQGLLLSREYFARLGGFDESLPFFEDQRIVEKIRSQGTLITLPGHLNTSARRFEREGFHRRYILMSMMMGLYNSGEQAFFERAPQVYRSQQETGRLQLSPFFEIIRDMMRTEWGVRGTIGVFYRLGRYIRQNSWQMFYFFDILARPVLGPGRYPFLGFHDRVFWPVTNFRVCDAITGLLCYIWFMGVLAGYFRLVDRTIHADNHLTRTGKERKL
jgi:rSAM/selenodomain-associated transferase 2